MKVLVWKGLQTQRMTQGSVHGCHISPCPQSPVNGCVQNSGEVIGHDDRVESQTGYGSFWRGNPDGYPTGMTETRKVAGNHRDDCLRQAGVQAIRLDD